MAQTVPEEGGTGLPASNSSTFATAAATPLVTKELKAVKWLCVAISQRPGHFSLRSCFYSRSASLLDVAGVDASSLQRMTCQRAETPYSSGGRRVTR